MARATSAEMIAAVEEAQGYVTRAADLLGISRKTFYVWMTPTVQDALENARARRHEWVESKLMKAIKDDNLTAIIFYLKTQGKHLGYVERQEMTGPDGSNVQIKVVYADDVAGSLAKAASRADAHNPVNGKEKAHSGR